MIIKVAAIAALLAGAWLVGAALIFLEERAVRLYWRIAHRKACGMQRFAVLRAEILESHITEGPDYSLLIAKLDLRVRCPMCKRVHRIVKGSVSPIPK